MTEPDFLQMYLGLRKEIEDTTDLMDARAIHRLIVVSFDRVLDRLGKLGFMPYVKVRRERRRVVPVEILKEVNVPQTEEEKLANMVIG